MRKIFRIQILGKRNAFISSDEVIISCKFFIFRIITRPKTAGPHICIQYYKIPLEKEYTNFFQRDIFCKALVAALNKKFSTQVQILNAENKSPEEKIAYTIVLSGSQIQQVSDAYDALEMFFEMCFKKIVLDKSLGNILY